MIQIVARRGNTFHARVFAPAIRKGIENGEDYWDIRDSIREYWNE